MSSLIHHCAQISLTANTEPFSFYSFLWARGMDCMCIAQNSSCTAEGILLSADFFVSLATALTILSMHPASGGCIESILKIAHAT